jgi:hypothetical protein
LLDFCMTWCTFEEIEGMRTVLGLVDITSDKSSSEMSLE